MGAPARDRVALYVSEWIIVTNLVRVRRELLGNLPEEIGKPSNVIYPMRKVCAVAFGFAHCDVIFATDCTVARPCQLTRVRHL